VDAWCVKVRVLPLFRDREILLAIHRHMVFLVLCLVLLVYRIRNLRQLHYPVRPMVSEDD